MADRRTIILHYHLFKNAGTSVDRVLQDSLPQRWVTAEFPASGGDNSALVAEWIAANPAAVAFSSHTMLGPLPSLPGLSVVSVLFLRDPLDRIQSAYRFEKTQNADTMGAYLARKHDFAGYVRARLAIPGDRQCRNFQTARLASLAPGPDPERDRAIRALDLLSVVGRVEAFADGLARLAEAAAGAGITLTTPQVHANRTEGAPEPIDAETRALLQEANQDDLELLRHPAAAIADPAPGTSLQGQAT